MLMSLPGLFGTAAQSIPADTPYLFADPARRGQWQARLGPRLRQRIRLVWAGHSIHPNNVNRSMDASLYEPLLREANATFYSLNKEAGKVPEAVIDLTGDLRDFAETAALISEIDLVITIDTVVAHLAGALGKPVWILLPYAPDFRWLAEGSTSKWYPTARLFRQQKPGDWESVIAEVSAALRS